MENTTEEEFKLTRRRWRDMDVLQINLIGRLGLYNELIQIKCGPKEVDSCQYSCTVRAFTRTELF